MINNTQVFTARQYMLVSNFELYHYCDSKLNDVGLHHHDFYEIYYFVDGSVDFFVEGKTYPLAPGNLLLISPQELHQARIQTDKHPYERYVLWLNKKYVEQFSMCCISLTQVFNAAHPCHSNLLKLNAQQRMMLRSYFSKLSDEQEKQAYGSELFCACLIVSLLLEIHRIADRACGQNYNLKDDKSDRLIRSVAAYIDSHYSQPLSLDELAGTFFVSKFHLAREFNRLAGTSVYKYLTQKRLLMARQMLAAGKAPTAIYHNCGFGDYANFYRAFRAEYNTSPAEFVKSLKQLEEAQNSLDLLGKPNCTKDATVQDGTE